LTFGFRKRLLDRKAAVFLDDIELRLGVEDL
jgi:hypothetical protein